MITSNQQILICIIIGIIFIFLFYKQSENFATNTEAINNIASLYNAANLTATNINATGSVNATGNVEGGGIVSQKDAWIKGNLVVSNSVNATGNVEGGGIVSQKDAWIKRNLVVSGEFKTPVDMTVKGANGWLALYDDATTRGRKTMCDDGYYVAGFIQDEKSPQYAVYPQCRKLPGF
jgi:hypothetical protein